MLEAAIVFGLEVASRCPGRPTQRYGCGLSLNGLMGSRKEEKSREPPCQNTTPPFPTFQLIFFPVPSRPGPSRLVMMAQPFGQALIFSSFTCHPSVCTLAMRRRVVVPSLQEPSSRSLAGCLPLHTTTLRSNSLLPWQPSSPVPLWAGLPSVCFLTSLLQIFVASLFPIRPRLHMLAFSTSALSTPFGLAV